MDDEYKTRANAAGALGNLVRNSSMLCAPIVQARALQVTCFRAPIYSRCVYPYADPRDAGDTICAHICARCAYTCRRGIWQRRTPTRHLQVVHVLPA